MNGEKLTLFWQNNRRDILLAIVVASISALSFGLGYFSALDENRTPIIIEKHSAE